ncbi:2-succinyl-5-enolpyruvyl-6-hydroxy-3-cyclohexene-1-carboxylic-acid synthase [Vibrio ezurae]|uniref:2-succinyl-5-enolpyruvyl-6-hydroxy-3-cyclohexene-1-carboxylate synthase n=1 Tax=Vibrio ezurae NBRC 102218 TaxID=1219080 RepID=U3CGI9_9VIBR|nr:2-succinyl-5-enolpyruvyl-6-hydroxy-3-cyclohexene-1-carboxylic-acid synthase [Vibrio ezurae]GAD80329.1 2-succinyl-5-enolpyruvyl-6-hydroxy-3-cyclohexene-1-carboxylate synthase [Vibrio ezurae NBRC 102218]
MSKPVQPHVSLTQLNQAQLNRVWSAVLIEEATRFGAQHVCIAPGSRSTPLALEAIRHNALTLHTHFDERGLGFFALGIAKATEQPVIVIVTSGTAVANLLPAVVEANLTGERLILLTADRPKELVGVGANQAIVQQGIFSSHVTQALVLPSPNSEIALDWLLSESANIMAIQAQLNGPIHINCPFPEPLYVAQSPQLNQLIELPSGWFDSNRPYLDAAPACSSSEDLHCCIQRYKDRKGLIVVGRLTHEKAKQVNALAIQLGWPILCDPQSGISSDWSGYDIWLQSPSANRELAQCQVILQFGARLVSKRLLSFIKHSVARPDFARYILVCDEPGVLNPDHLPMLRLEGEWQLDSTLHLQSSSREWGDGLKAHSINVLTQAKGLASTTITEIEVAMKLHELTDGFELFLGNSLGVRLVDMLSTKLNSRVFSNRGASGIDGLIATSAGVGVASKQPTLTLLGDTSLLHDLNSLSLLAQSGGIVLVLNNDGGAIFDMLPVDDNHKQRLYQMPHGYQFKQAAQQFNMGYARPSTWAQLQQLVADFDGQSPRSLLIEVVTPAGQASAHIKSLSLNIQSQ